MNLRDEARDRDCQVRLAGICNHNRSTVVLAHLRLAGITGVGMKAPDQLGAWACSDCHAEADRRTCMIDRDLALRSFYEGIFRTQAILIKEGKIR